MNDFFTAELKARCSEINSGENDPEMVKKVGEAYDRIIRYENLSRKEDLLSLEDENRALRDKYREMKKIIDQIKNGRIEQNPSLKL